MKYISWRAEWFFILLAFLLPLVFFFNVFTTKSFGFDCAPSVMGNNPPYGQEWKAGNNLCSHIPDPGAYVWQHPAHWVESARQYMQGMVPVWTQNIGLGFPLAANFQSSVYFLPLLPFILLFKISGNNLLYLDLFFVSRYMIMAAGMYLFLRTLGMNRLTGYIGAVAYFCSGYFIVLPNIAHHNVDILLPWVAYAIATYYITRQSRWIAFGAFFSAISLFGGMPESSIFVLFFSAVFCFFLSFIYYPFTELTQKTVTWSVYKKHIDLKSFGGGLAIIAIGLLLSAILYVPGLEFISYGGSLHHSSHGIQKSIPFYNIISFMFPEMYIGPTFLGEMLQKNLLPYTPTVWNYIGSTMSFLFIMALTYLIASYKSIFKNKYVLMLGYFAVLSIVLLLQNYGIATNIIFDHFPVFSLTIFPKYSSALINFSVITAVCLMLYQMKQEEDIKRRGIIVVSLIIFTIIAVSSTLFVKPALAEYKHFLKVWYFPNNVTYGLIFAGVISFVIALWRARGIYCLVILAIVLVEFFNYFPKGGYQGRYDTLRAPPAVTYLQSINDGTFRIHAGNNILYPNMSTIYDLNDFRLLDALWIKRHYAYVEHFYQAPNEMRIIGVQEANATEPAKMIQNPYFNALSVKYVLSYNTLDALLLDKSALIQEVITSHPPQKDEVPLGSKTYKLQGIERSALFAHAPNTASFTVTKPMEAEYLIIYPVMDTAIPLENKGDGVLFTARAYNNDSLLSEKIADTTSSASLAWEPMQLGPFQKGVEIPLRIELDTFQKNDNAYDWSAWAGFYWDSEQQAFNENYKEIYNKEMRIYENKQYVPRLRFVNNTECVQESEDSMYENTFAKLEQLGQAVTTTALIESRNCSPQKFSTASATITNQRYNDQSVTFTYSAKDNQYAVLSDVYYPGWNVYINGRKGTIDPVNLTMRGVPLPAGQDMKVEMKYEPLSFFIGLGITLISFFISLFLIVKNRRV